MVWTLLRILFDCGIRIKGDDTVTIAKVTCLDCNHNFTVNCILGFDSEKELYLKFKPRCRNCNTEMGNWKIEEIVEIRPPLTESEKSLFALAKQGE